MIPLELWDLWSGGRILWERMREPAFPLLLRDTLVSLRRGEGATRSEGPVPAAIAGFDSLFVSGGRSIEPEIRSALSSLDIPVAFSLTPENPGVEEGLRLLTRLGGTTPCVCDLGQTSFKVRSAAGRMQFQRDLQRLPIRRDHPDEAAGRQRQQLRHWLGESLRAFAEKMPPPDALLIALPSRLDDAAVPEGSSYIGMASDATLVADLIGLSGLTPRVVLAMNDAELATLDAPTDPALTSCAMTLVITLGFGLGAALALRAAHSHA